MLEIVERGNLAGGMPRQRQADFGRVDAAAIVANANQPATAALQFDFDAPRAGVQRVFHQLLDHGGRALDDLAGSDLTDEGVGQ